MDENNQHRSYRWSQIARIVAPFFLLLLCIGVLQVVPRIPTESNIIAVSATSSPTIAALTNRTMPTVTLSPSITVTPSPPVPKQTSLPTASPTEAPSIPPSAEILLLGPPAESTIGSTEIVSFYWLWPTALAEDQEFLVYLFIEEQSYLIGHVDEPNLGKAYRLHYPLDNLEQSAAEATWQIVLATINSDESVIDLLESERRTLNLASRP